jgi:pimeloyl-ACP methyl ester carboxylesterase
MSGTSESIQPARFSIDLSDGALTGWRWANPQKLPLLFLHATGFCASTYRQMLGGIGGAFDLYALDLRGHGRNGLPAAPNQLRSWRPYVDDVRAFLDLQNRTGWTLSGHSLGAATALMAARGRKDIAALRLIEPVAPAEWLTIMAKTPVWPLMSRRIPLVRMAARRRNEWPDRQSALNSYARKGLFKDWAPGVLEDYLHDGLKDGDGGPTGSVTLACHPAWEAATFAAQGNDFWPAARSSPAPVKVYAADHASSTMSLAGRRRLEQLGASVLVKSGVTHLAPMEIPADLAAFIAS